MRKKYVPEHMMIHDGVYYNVRYIPYDLAIDAIVGWLSAGVGNSYGDEYLLGIECRWMKKIVF